jgi:uncharacterized protein
MFSRLVHLLRDLTGRNDHELLGHLAAQLDATLAGVAMARALAGGEIPPAEARTRLEDIERRGDDARRALIDELTTTLTAPVDREDLFRLSRSVDDVLDNLRDLAREFDLYGIDHEPLLTDVLAGVETGVVELREAITRLVDEPDRAGAAAADAKKNDVRLSYQQAMGALLGEDGPVDRTTLARRELLRRSDVIGLRLAEAANALRDGTVKRSL